MKQTFTFLLTAMTVTISFGQITTTKIAPKNEEPINASYDSTENFLAKDVYDYIGQELYVIGKVESLRKYGYSGFVLDYTKSTLGNDRNVYRCCESYNSKYADLVGRYFKVLAVFKHPKAEENENLYGKKFYLKLQDKENQDIVYFEFDSQYDFNFPFVVVGFFEKRKKDLIGQEFVFADRVIKYRFFGDANPKPSLDINTGKELTITRGEKWKCIDLTIEEEHFTLSLIIQNSFGEKVAMDYNTVFGKYHIGRAYTANEADNYRKSFGSDNFDLLLQGKVKIGFTKEMCRMSWGEPKDINETITSGKKSEQWVYEKNYLYFENGVLTAMQ